MENRDDVPREEGAQLNTESARPTVRQDDAYQDDGQQGNSSQVRCDTVDDFPPQEDHIQRLWTPQRMAYVLAPDKEKSPRTGQCPFCEAPKKSDEDGLIVWRGTKVFVIMNLYPYNVGHVMVCPYRHVSLLTDLDDDELIEFEKTSAQAMRVMDKVSHPDGWNLGINQGEVAGAGIASHLHQHIVPRWNGDSNFMPIVAQTRTMPILLSDQRSQYAQAFAALYGTEDTNHARPTREDPNERDIDV